jgi:hypothetical protein
MNHGATTSPLRCHLSLAQYELLEVFGRNLRQRRCAADFHREGGGELRPSECADLIVKRGHPGGVLRIEKRVVFSMGIGIACHRREDHRIQHVPDVQHGCGGPFTDHLKALGQRRPTFLLVFA